MVAPARPPLAAPSGPQAFDVDAAAAGERLDRFLGRSASERRLALSRTRIKALIEAGEVTVDGATARDPAAKLVAGARDPIRGAASRGDLAQGRGHAARRRVRGRAPDRDRQAGRPRRPSGARPCRGHAGQRADQPLRREPFGDRRGPAPGHRPPAGQGHVRASRRRQDRRRPSGTRGPVRRPRPQRLLEREYLALVWGGFDVSAGKVDAADRAASPPSRENGGRVRRARPPRRDPLAGGRGVRARRA